MKKIEKQFLIKILKTLLFLIAVLINIFFNDIKIIGSITVVLVIVNLLYNKFLIKNLKMLRVLLIFYIFTIIFQILLNQNGEVLYKVHKWYITKEGAIQGLLNFLRVINLLLLSWIATSFNIFETRLNKYSRIIENVISLIPEVIDLFKKKMKIKWFFRDILKKVKNKI